LPPFVEIDFEVAKAREQMKGRRGIMSAMFTVERMPIEVGTVQRTGEVQLRSQNRLR